MMYSRPPAHSTNELEIIQALGAAGGAEKWITAFGVTRNARSEGSDLNAPTVYRVLSRLRSEVEYRTIDRVRKFHLKRNGQLLLGRQSSSDPVFVMPGTPWSTPRQLRTFLGNHVHGSLLVVDPYISEETLDVLAEVNTPIQIAAASIGRKGKEDEFLRAYKKFKKEKKGRVELRMVPAADLHGRYLFTDSGSWVVDHSLQDLGTKPALILPLHLGAVGNQVQSYFSTLFRGGKLVI